MRVFLVLAVYVLSPLLVSAQAHAPIAIYVGPQTRDGFVDVDAGVLASIADIQTALKKSPLVTVVTDPARARVRLYVLARHFVASGDSVGIPIGAGMTVNADSKHHVIDSRLTVDTYERTFSSDDQNRGTWKAAGQAAADDVLAWVQANRSRIE